MMNRKTKSSTGCGNRLDLRAEGGSGLVAHSQVCLVDGIDGGLATGGHGGADAW